MFCKATVLVLGTLATNRIVLYAAMQFVKGTLWKNTMNGQFCMMKNQTSLLNNSEDISSANYLNNRKKDLQKENASRISLWAFAGFWTLFQFHLCFSSIRKRWQISTRKQQCPFIHWLWQYFFQQILWNQKEAPEYHWPENADKLWNQSHGKCSGVPPGQNLHFAIRQQFFWDNIYPVDSRNDFRQFR